MWDPRRGNEQWKMYVQMCWRRLQINYVLGNSMYADQNLCVGCQLRYVNCEYGETMRKAYWTANSGQNNNVVGVANNTDGLADY